MLLSENVVAATVMTVVELEKRLGIARQLLHRGSNMGIDVLTLALHVLHGVDLDRHIAFTSCLCVSFKCISDIFTVFVASSACTSLQQDEYLFGRCIGHGF
eukprot:TRINITY_DN34677_c0_g1_i1.p1 TRINITY_DN34677_c0_g1~~TRINITY_DN34677_c0_g1_i1.p1  ORF type:complete len:101 (-),score=15.06 TRINITY_DN34677_c0_g1_i1:56-358(-)